MTANACQCCLLQMDVDDWDASYVLEGYMTAVMGTARFAAISVLQGGPHSLSSMLEGLFYSILYICSAGRLPEQWPLKQSRCSRLWADVRLGSMWQKKDARSQFLSWEAVTEHVGLLSALCQLFFGPGRGCCYRKDVTAEQFCAVCEPFVFAAAQHK
jgi:hypothetical protein